MNMNVLRSRRAAIPTLLLAGGLSLAGCESSTAAAPSPSEAAQASAAPVSTSQSAGKSAVEGMLRFNSHGSDPMRGGSSIIYTYSNPSEAGRGHDNATFKDGQIVDATCETDGRLINRITQEGEDPGGSTKWVKFALPERVNDTTGGPVYSFGSEAYGDTLGGHLPLC